MRNILFIALMTLVAASNLGAASSNRTPDLSFRDLAGSKVSIGELRGSIAVVNFWATWCAPCREEFPMLSSLAQRYAGKVRFVSISADDDPNSKKQRAEIHRFLADQQPGMEIWVGADLDALGRCGLGRVLPATLVLDAKGQVVARIEGQAREQDITTPIEWLLQGQIGPEPPALLKRY